MDEKDQIQESEFSLDDIVKEFGSSAEEAPEAPEQSASGGVTSDTVRLDKPLKGIRGKATRDTVRLDKLPQGLKGTPKAAAVLDREESAAQPEKKAEDAFFDAAQLEYDDSISDYIPPIPLIPRRKSRLQELKKELVAGPERLYYELTQTGLGKLQAAVLLNSLITVLVAASTVMYALDLVRPERLKFTIFMQVLAMLFSGLLGAYRLMEGVGDLLKKKFTLNTLLFLTFLACCADGAFCLFHQKMPCCAAFCLEMTMCTWSAYQRRHATIGQMDTMRKATRLDSIVRQPDFHEGRAGFLRSEGQVRDFMDNYDEVPGPEKALNLYAIVALIVSAAVGVTAFVLHGPVLAVRALAAALLAAVPATMFITCSRPNALLEKRMHRLGTVICGWQGIMGLAANGVFPLGDRDLFPDGTVKMNGVKFYGDRTPDQVVSFAAALMKADGSGLAPLFQQLLESRNGRDYPVENLQFYGNGGIGGEVLGEPVIIGTMAFMQDMGVEIPEGTRVNQALYVAIDGQLSGLFAITYSKSKSSASGLATLCGYRGLTPVLTTGDFMVDESFLRTRFSVKTRRMAIPSRADRVILSLKTPDAGLPALALTVTDGLAPAAFAVTGARALRSACRVGAVVHILGGALGLAMMLALAILGAESLLTPANLFAYQLIWMIPGMLISEWTRSL